MTDDQFQQFMAVFEAVAADIRYLREAVEEAAQVLRKMAQEGLLKAYRHNSGVTITVRYSKAPRNWASVAWRKHSDSWCGITA